MSDDHDDAAFAGELQRKLENLDYDCSEGLEAALDKFRADHQVADGTLWQALSQQGGYTFSEVLQYELDALGGVRPRRYRPAEPAAVHARAHDAVLAGLAFSGGGIRSATFNLGVIQALADMRLLRQFDYLSTVSGGGYIGGWLTKWIAEEAGDVGKVEDALAGRAGDAALPRRQPWAVQFLRRYSNYLTPRPGLFSADTWTLICTYCRNTSLNITMLFAWLALLFLFPRWVVLLVPAAESGTRSWPWLAAAIVPFLWVVFCIAMSISRKGKLPWRGWASQSQSAVLWWICIPLVVAGFAGAIVVWGHRRQFAAYWNGLPSTLMHPDSAWLLVPGLLYLLAWLAGWGVAQRLNRQSEALATPRAADTPPHHLKSQVAGHFLSAVTALTLGTVLLLKSVSLLVAPGATTAGCAAAAPAAGTSAAAAAAAAAHCARLMPPVGDDFISRIQLVTLGMPAMLLLFGIAVTLMIGLIGRLYRDQSREWWARHGAWTTICAIGWLVLFGSTFYLPPLLDYAWTNAQVSTSLGAALTGLATAFGLKAGSGKATGAAGAVAWKDLIAKVAPYLFMVLTIAGLTTFLQWLAAPQPVMYCDCHGNLLVYVEAFEQSSEMARWWASAKLPLVDGVALLPLTVLFLLTALVLGWRVDVNKFSLYMMYRLRLVRAYFGASTENRAPHPFTGFDPLDDPKLADLLEQRDAGGATTGVLQRPYHLINTAVNMVGGKELAWQTRKAGNFCFSPAFSGFELPQMPPGGKRSNAPRGAYRPTEYFASRTRILKDDDAGVHLGMAIAVSGAAASPSMGYHSSPPLSFLMTLFNLRLGRWTPNPVRARAWMRAAPGVGIFSILSELFGLTDTTADFLYLSDGGHFENLGLYELVRRRCRLVVVVDASADSDYEFGDLGNAIRKCLTDFNVPITLKTSDIRSLGATPPPRSVSFVTGSIQYSQADGPAAQDGTLLYIKPIIVGDENADIVNYSRTNKGFPHQSTADQWFDEDQFEAYRSLGQSAASSALKDIAGALHATFGDTGADAGLRRRKTENLCEQLRQRAMEK